MNNLLKIVITIWLISISILAKAGPDTAVLCERTVILSKYFTPNFMADKSYATPFFKYEYQYCQSSLQYLYEPYALPEWPPYHIQYKDIIKTDVNAVSILSIQKDYVASSNTQLVLSLNTKLLEQKIQQTKLDFGHSNDELLAEIITILNLIFAEEQQANPEQKAYRLKVKVNKMKMRNIGFTDELLGQLNGQWHVE